MKPKPSKPTDISEFFKKYPHHQVSELVNSIKDMTAKYPTQYHAGVFDVMTKNGFKLDLITGDYEFRLK